MMIPRKPAAEFHFTMVKLKYSVVITRVKSNFEMEMTLRIHLLLPSDPKSSILPISAEKMETAAKHQLMVLSGYAE
jgi:hypothetical protein